jgi:hypothetical protein
LLLQLEELLGEVIPVLGEDSRILLTYAREGTFPAVYVTLFGSFI